MCIVIDRYTIVEKSDSIKSPEHLQHLFLRPEYCSRVFRKILCAAPPAIKRRKHFLYYEYFCIGIVYMY